MQTFIDKINKEYHIDIIKFDYVNTYFYDNEKINFDFVNTYFSYVRSMIFFCSWCRYIEAYLLLPSFYSNGDVSFRHED